MIIQCESCSRKFAVKDVDIPVSGRTVQCGYCSVSWHQMPVEKKVATIEKKEVIEPFAEIEIDEIKKVDESPSIDNIEASDGKTYKFLGNQWAQLLPSGKTGLFAKKKISRELDRVTGRKENKIIKRKPRKLHEVNPSSENFINEKNQANVYQKKHGLGFFGYIFLIVIIAFSFVGILKTFETDLLNYFPEIEYIFELFDEQLEFFAESFRNLIVIINDLINSY
jgi:predicted Zn finger-like uncharacterized protein